ncbi:MAG: hypothetical protein R3B45_12945 [Bdellovibrionota bacterium]
MGKSRAQQDFNLRPLTNSYLLKGIWPFIIFLYSCGAEDPTNSDDNNSDKNSGVLASTTQSQQSGLINIPISFSNSSGHISSFSLTGSASSYQINLSDCLSGYSNTVTEADAGGLKAYRYDRGCLAKLTEFTVSGVTYYPTAGDPFSTWQVGDTATFDEIGEPGTSPLKVKILSTIGDPITGLETISYGFADAIEGNNIDLLWTSVGSTQQLQSGVDTPPSFTIKSIELVDFNGSEAGQFKIVLECTSDIGATNACETVNFSDTDYMLIEDTFSSSMTITDADSAFTAGNSITLPDDRVAPGAMGTTNGGFVTVVLDGPADLAATPNMILLLRSYTASYQYFNIDVTVTTTF